MGGVHVNVSCEHAHRAFHPLDASIGVTGNTSNNMWAIECDNCTNSFFLPRPSQLPTCKCIVSSALEQYSSIYNGTFTKLLQMKNFTPEPLEGTEPINIGDKITFKCNEPEAEVGNSTSNECKCIVVLIFIS